MIPRTLACLLAALLVALPAWPQFFANKGSVSGVVTDAAAAPLPAARVTLTNWRTGWQRSLPATTAGLYRFDALDPGVYELRGEATGFAASIVGNIVVPVGGSIRVNLTVRPEAVVEATPDALSLVRGTETYPSQVVGELAIRDLPINGRRFQEFATLTPTAQANEVTRGQLSFVGQRGVNTNVMVDGTDYNQPLLGGIRGGERSPYAFTLPQSAVQEFQAVTAGYTPEYGRSTGGVLNVITRSGTNGFHGDLFYLLRHQGLGLENPYGQAALERQHQFGGSFGGPIARNRTFFFAAAEQQVARFPRQVRFSALDDLAVPVTPDLAPALTLFRSLERPFTQTNDATAVLGRVDHQFSQGTRLAIRYNASRAVGDNAAAFNGAFQPLTNVALSANGDERGNTHTAAGQLTNILNPSLINDFRAQYSREERNATAASATGPTVLSRVIGVFGARNFLPAYNSDDRFQLADSLTLLRGSHTLAFGADYNHLRAFQDFAFNQFGAFTIENPDVRSVLRILSGSGGNRFDDPTVTYSRLIGNRIVGARAQQVALFAQDQWRATSNLSLNYGLRWEGQFNPSPAVDNEFLLANIQDFAFPLGRVNPASIPNQVRQFAPRLGFAWNVRGADRTVVRGQVGVFYGQTPLYLYMDPLNNFRVPRGNLSLNIVPRGTSTVYQQFLAGGVNLNSFPLGELPVFSVEDVTRVAGPGRNPYAGSWTVSTAGNFQNPRATQATFGLEHRIARGLVVDYQFFYVNTVHLHRNVDYNVPQPFVRPGDASQRPFFGLRSGVTRPNPNVGFVLVRDSSARSVYQGHAFRTQYRSGRWQVAGNYTLGYNRSDDDSERTPWATNYLNPFDLRREYNWSALDARHQVSGYALFSAPFGIDLTGLFRYRSGLPIDPFTGADTSELLGNVNSLVPFANFGSRPLESPGVPFLRNSFRNRGYRTVDVRVLKSFRVSESARLQLSGELFNLFNFANVAFQGPASIYGLGILPSGERAPVDPRFLRLRTRTGAYDPATTFQVGSPLQAQFGLRLLF